MMVNVLPNQPREKNWLGRQAMFASINLLIFGSMKTKRTVFEVNDVYRVMENSELIYTLTNSCLLYTSDAADEL